MTCKGICTQYIAKFRPSLYRYSDGQKRCQICSLFVNWEGVFCPCCNTKLRSKPRNTRSRRLQKIRKLEI